MIVLAEKEIKKEELAKEEGTKEIDSVELYSKKELERVQKLKNKGKGKIEQIETLECLTDEENGNFFIGRKKSVQKKYGYEGALHLGKVHEQGQDNTVFLDGLNPHVVFVCGARGSGKSYVLGVLAEELALKNKNVGIVVIDPVGVFWSMKYPNREEREVKMLGDWDLEPQGLDNLKVFIPKGEVGKVPKETYDDAYSVSPGMLTTDDWCLTFNLDRFSPTGLLLEKSLQKVRKGYINTDGLKIKGKKDVFSLEDLVQCLVEDSEINSKDKGYKKDSIRALTSRFEAAKNWGIFDKDGTPLTELSTEGQLTIIDVSFLDENVAALLIGILARRLLAARKISTRKVAAKKLTTVNVNDLLELEIPPTWLFLDEAHTLIPSGNQATAATNAIIEYVKQGRRPGCSLAFATQQPSAINSKVLSQLDILMSYKLVFDDDIKAVSKRVPTIVPKPYQQPSFIKTLNIGTALTGDRSDETNRAFVMRVRPRMSQHEGRETESIENSDYLQPDQVEDIVTEILVRKFAKSGELELSKARKIIDTLNKKYEASVNEKVVVFRLQDKGFEVSNDKLVLGNDLKGKDADEIISDGSNEVITKGNDVKRLKLFIDKNQAYRIAEEKREKKKWGLIGNEETVVDVGLKYVPLWKIDMQVFETINDTRDRQCYIDALMGEFIHYVPEKGFKYSKGLNVLFNLDKSSIEVLFLTKTPVTMDDIIMKTTFSQKNIKIILNQLMKIGLIETISTRPKKYKIKDGIGLPTSAEHKLLESMNDVKFEDFKPERKALEKENFLEERLANIISGLWQGTAVKNISKIYKPYWICQLKGNGNRRIVIDAYTGNLKEFRDD